jgi:hypothetical protein
MFRVVVDIVYLHINGLTVISTLRGCLYSGSWEGDDAKGMNAEARCAAAEHHDA